MQAELRAEDPCWEAAPRVLVSGNRDAAGRAGGGRALSEDGGPAAACHGHSEAEPAAGLRARPEGRQRHLRGRLQGEADQAPHPGRALSVVGWPRGIGPRSGRG